MKTIFWSTGLMLMLWAAGQAAPRNSVSQFGITWTFDQAYETGQFVNGDWWVVGPVVIASVNPAPGTAGANEQVRTDYVTNFINQFGDTDLQDNTSMRNGSMVNPEWSGTQGYDSGCPSYSADKSIGFPYNLGTDESLVSTISNTTLPNDQILPFYNEQSRSVVRTAAVLTCLAQVPPADAFRPPFASTWKPIYQAGNLRRELLPNLAPVAATPSIADMERLVERPWLDHVNSWMAGTTGPMENMANYGREYARIVSLVGLRLMIEGPTEDKETLLIRFVQIGIDLHGLRKAGATYQEGGGITSGRKWPIVFASILLDDQDMKTFPGASEFHEDQQTYYGLSWTGETALWQMVFHHVPAALYEHRHPDTYDDMDLRSHSYRTCCTGLSWIGEALGALLISAKRTWNHDAFFDYCDRYMNEDPAPYREAGLSASLLGEAFDEFVNNMYYAYWETVPVQASARENMMWLTDQWVEDPDAPPADIKDAPLPHADKTRGVLVRLISDAGDGNIYFDVSGIEEGLQLRSTLQIYNNTGSLIRKINRKPFTWDGRNHDGIRVKSGVYHYLIETGEKTYTGKFLKAGNW
jgi:hypothetical protein